MLTRQEKQGIIQKLTTELKQVKGLVFADFTGLKTKDLQVARGQLSKEGGNYQVVKITLLKRALQQAGIDSQGLNFTVPLSITYSKSDEVVAARVMNEFAKKNENFKILGGILDKKLIDIKAVKILASLPTKPELYGQFAQVIASPMKGFVSVLSGNMRKFVYALNAVANKKQAV